MGRTILHVALAAVLTLPAVAGAKPGRADADRMLALGDSLLGGGDYPGAEAAYATVASWGWTSAALAHNRGLAALRAGRIGEAVAHLLDARRVAPREPAVLQSLAAARATAGILAVPAPSTSRGVAALATPAGIVGLVVLAAASGVAAVWQRRRKELALVLALFAVASWTCAGAAWVSSTPLATVVTPTQLHAAPASASRAGEDLRPGRTVRIGRSHGAWVRARVPGGPAGWLPAHALVY